MNVHNMLSYCDLPVCQNLLCMCQRAKSKDNLARLKFMVNIKIFILRSIVKVLHRSWIYATHRTIVVHSSAKHRMNMSKDKKVLARKQSHVINPLNLTLRSKVNVVSGLWMYVTYPFIVIDPCARYQMPLSKQTELTGLTRRQDKNL